MREEKFLNALAFLDDSMIEAVNKRREQKKKQKMYVMRILAGVACMCIVFAGLLVSNTLYLFLQDKFKYTGDYWNRQEGSWRNEESIIGVKPRPTIETNDELEINILETPVWIYYVDQNQLQREQRKYRVVSREEIFAEWRILNGIGEEVELIHCELEDNSTTAYSKINGTGIVTTTAADYFILRLVVSANISNYYDEIDSELLLESLKKTMMLGKEYDEYYISFE